MLEGEYYHYHLTPISLFLGFYFVPMLCVGMRMCVIA